MSISRYARIAGDVVGPLGVDEIRSLAAEGKVTPDTAVSRDAKRWVRAGLIVGLLADPEGEEADAALVAPPITPPPPPISSTPPPAAEDAVDRTVVGFPVAVSPATTFESLLAPPVTSASARSKLARLSSERSFWQALALAAAFVAATLMAYQFGYQHALESVVAQNSRPAVTTGLAKANDGPSRNAGVRLSNNANAQRLVAELPEAKPATETLSPAKAKPDAPIVTAASSAAIAPLAKPPHGPAAPLPGESELSRADTKPLSPIAATPEAAKPDMAKAEMPASDAPAIAPEKNPAEAKPTDAKPADAMPAAAPKAAKADVPKPDMAKPAEPKAAANAKPVFMNERQRRRLLVLEAGGTAQSEAAVEAALKWLAEHQMADGGWSFDHRHGLCNGRCDTPGAMVDARNGATALALLPFLAAGNAADSGPYQKNVAAGLAFLIAKIDKKGSLYEGGGRMYSHGLATIALCDAYNMTREMAMQYDSPGDAKLIRRRKRAKAGEKDEVELERERARQRLDVQRVAAQRALDFIVQSQNRTSGGWRYEPGDVGDTSVVAWQLMALKAGHLAELKVPEASVRGAATFLNSVQGYGGSVYSYLPGRNNVTPAADAAGLYCQIVLARDRNDDGFARGATAVANTGLLRDNMYYNFYATQLLRHFGGANWEKWNPPMRDMLVMSQRAKGHEAGSWVVGGAHAAAGGRLYDTALACLTLEVYYRYKPAYESPGDKLNPPAAMPDKDEKPPLTKADSKSDAAMALKQ